jgi:sortase (surface protein transpeptidase)
MAVRWYDTLPLRLVLFAMIPLFTMSSTIVVLYNYAPRYQAVDASSMVSIAVPTQLPVNDISAPAISVSIPTNMSINKIHVDTPIQPVGLTAQGNMDIDDNPKQAAWYMNGPKPGERGSAVIAGHYGWKAGVPSVFNDLNKLVAGDEIKITSANGNTMRFVVVRLAMYAPDQDATDVFRSDDAIPHLNLVTCQGTWNNSARTYTERLVVFTNLVVQ